MSDRYIWDKRDMKRNFIKFGLILISCFFVMLAVSYLLEGKMSSGAIVALCVTIGLVLVVIELIIINAIKKKVAKINEEKEREAKIEEEKLRQLENQAKQEEKNNIPRKKGTRKNPRKSNKNDVEVVEVIDNDKKTEKSEVEEEIKIGETDKYEFTKTKNDNVIKITKRK